MTATAIDEVVETRTTDDAGEAAHIVYVDAASNMTPQAVITAARVEGFHVIALCGYTWIPSKDPKPLPVCARCLDIYQQDGDHRDERDELPESA